VIPRPDDPLEPFRQRIFRGWLGRRECPTHEKEPPRSSKYDLRHSWTRRF